VIVWETKLNDVIGICGGAGLRKKGQHSCDRAVMMAGATDIVSQNQLKTVSVRTDGNVVARIQSACEHRAAQTGRSEKGQVKREHQITGCDAKKNSPPLPGFPQATGRNGRSADLRDTSHSASHFRTFSKRRQSTSIARAPAISGFKASAMCQETVGIETSLIDEIGRCFRVTGPSMDWPRYWVALISACSQARA
jgi:hypothetical protein